MEKFFKLKEHNTNVKRELMAGLTTFMAMAYILAVNPNILGDAGMDRGAVFTATALSSAIASVCMGFMANLPFVLSAGMGLNAYFAYTVVLGMGASWELALFAVFVEGIIFILLSITNVREAIFDSIPQSVKTGVSVGIGLFITFIALKSAYILVDNSSTLVGLYPFAQSFRDGTIHTSGIQAALAIIGILFTGLLVHKNVKGNILIGILFTWVLGIICELGGLYDPNPELGFYSTIPSGFISMPQSMGSTINAAFRGMREIQTIGIQNFLVVMIAFLFVDIFDTLGTLIGCAQSGKMLDKNGKLPGMQGALLADAIGTTVGAVLGTSTITTFVESSAGIAAGGRTGLTAIAAGVIFLISLFFSPIFLAIPGFATTPALVIVGYLMMRQVVNVPWDDATESIPAFMAIFAMPFFYSISEGIAFGLISYTVINLLAGQSKKIHPLLYVLCVLFILKYALL